MNSLPWMKLYYKLLEWEWRKSPEMVSVWIYLLLTASRETKKVRGMTVRRGQIATSRSELASECGITARQVRTCLTRLKTSKQVTVKTSNKLTIITICNYSDYQPISINERPAERPTERPASDQQTTSKRPADENTPISSFLRRKSKHIESVEYIARTREGASPQKTSEKFVHFEKWIEENAPSVARLRDPFTEDQFNKLSAEFSAQEVRDILLQMHNKPDLAKKYRSAYLTALNWLRRAGENSKRPSGDGSQFRASESGEYSSTID